ncbi:hypothetical protein BK662_17905 [Pseudomonas frederiksbergensis]|uniref:Uncharacterized protein n=1 Tax=Pseudomonas frederiksbergensis TaxID=104087 RepID=A0A423HME9_9PSED|nr:hypothetical protein BK662_17905 [Pseudomonas frederiksbergensis]
MGCAGIRMITGIAYMLNVYFCCTSRQPPQCVINLMFEDIDSRIIVNLVCVTKWGDMLLAKSRDMCAT